MTHDNIIDGMDTSAIPGPNQPPPMRFNLPLVFFLPVAKQVKHLTDLEVSIRARELRATRARLQDALDRVEDALVVTEAEQRERHG
jgi:hypothetical protein